MRNRKTYEVNVGGLSLGANNPIIVQSMCCVPAEDYKKNIKQILELSNAGCEIVRVSVPSDNALKCFAELCKKSPVPLVADIHFRPDLAVRAIESGASKIRINPGNFGDIKKSDKVISCAKHHNVPIRIGINAGSLDEKLKARTDLKLTEKLVASACQYVDYFNKHDFGDIVVSIKAHDVNTCIDANRLFATKMPQVPLHLGITEAGTKDQGIIKSAAGLGILLSEGIGETIRISLTDDPVEEVKAC